MSESAMNLATKMDALKRKYLVQLETKIETLKIFVAACESGKPDNDQIRNIADLAHKLCGSGATYGFTAISDTAQVLEDLLNVKPNVAESVMAIKAKLLIEACEHAHGSLPLSSPHDNVLSMDDVENKGGLPVVLLVDDDETIRQLLPQIFHGEAQIVVARNGREALDILSHLMPSVILLDDQMPDLGGFEFLEELKKKNETYPFGIIMLTASRKNADVIMAFRFGVVDYISKPFDPAALKFRVMDFIQRNRRKILIADDDPAIRNILGVKFRALGYQIILTEDCESAYARAISEQPNLLILDRMLPGGDGLALYLKIKQALGDKPIPTVFLTAKRRENDIVEALKQGADDYVVKPIKVDEVIARCTRLIVGKDKVGP